MLREAVRLKPNHAWAYSNLGFAFEQLGNFEAAVSAYETALTHRPDDPHLNENLGLVLRLEGRYDDAARALRTAADLSRSNPRFRENLLIELALTERLSVLGARIPDLIRGTITVQNAPDALAVARLAYDRRLYASASRLWQAAFELDPNTASDMHAGYRYNAASAAAMAGCGRGKDNPPPDEKARVALRLRALQWLRDDLDSWSLIITSGVGSYSARAALNGWSSDRDLIGVRSEPAIENLPETERKLWRDLWREHARVLKMSPP